MVHFFTINKRTCYIRKSSNNQIILSLCQTMPYHTLFYPARLKENSGTQTRIFNSVECTLSAHHENLRRVCIMPVVDGFGLALDVSGLSRN